MEYWNDWQFKFGFAKVTCHKNHMSNQLKNPSPLVQAVLNLDAYMLELVRLGDKISEMELRSEFDFEQAQKLMNRFTQCGQGVADGVIQLSTSLNEARTLAEAAAHRVSMRAEQLQSRKNEEQAKMEQLRALTEKVKELTASLNEEKRPENTPYTPEEKARISVRLAQFEIQLHPLIQEARDLKLEAQGSKMKILEQSADSLEQSLSAISKKLVPLQH